MKVLRGWRPLAAVAERASTTDEVRSCLTTQWFRFAFARQESDDDAGTLRLLNDAFRKSDYRIPELVVAIAASKSFRYRQPVRSP